MNMFRVSRFNLLILLLLQPRQLLLQPTEPEFSSPTESQVANSTPEGIQEATAARVTNQNE